MRTIAVISQKGGVGKTTTVANLGAAIADAGRDICLIDLDPQSHLTLHLGVEPGTPAVSVYDMLTANASLQSAVQKVSQHLWLVPSVIDLAAAEVELVSTVGREQILRDHLAAEPLPYELVMIDCPPSLGLLTLNALAAADEVLIPLQPHFLALQGLGKLLETVSLVQRRINPRLKVSGVILCMYESSTRLAGEVVNDLREFFAASRNARLPWSDTRILQAVIRRNVKLAECPSYGKTIFDYAPGSHGAEDYRRLAEEFLGLSLQQPAAATGAEAPHGSAGPQGAVAQPAADPPAVQAPPARPAETKPAAAGPAAAHAEPRETRAPEPC